MLAFPGQTLYGERVIWTEHIGILQIYDWATCDITQQFHETTERVVNDLRADIHRTVL